MNINSHAKRPHQPSRLYRPTQTLSGEPEQADTYLRSAASTVAAGLAGAGLGYFAGNSTGFLAGLGGTAVGLAAGHTAAVPVMNWYGDYDHPLATIIPLGLVGGGAYAGAVIASEVGGAQAGLVMAAVGGIAGLVTGHIASKHGSPN